MNNETGKKMKRNFLTDQQHQEIDQFLSQYENGFSVAHAYIVRELEIFSKRENKDMYFTFCVSGFPYPEPKSKQYPYIYVNLPETFTPEDGASQRKYL